MYLEACERIFFLSILDYNLPHHNLSHWSFFIILPVSYAHEKSWLTESILFLISSRTFPSGSQAKAMCLPCFLHLKHQKTEVKQTTMMRFVGKDDFSWWQRWKSTQFLYFKSLDKNRPWTMVVVKWDADSERQL